MKKKHILILLGLTALTITACSKNKEKSSVTEQDIQEIKIEENSSALQVEDAESNQQVLVNTEDNYRTLSQEGLDKYNKQYRSINTIRYFYSDEKDTSIAVAKVYPVLKDKQTYFADLEKNVKAAFPNAEYTQGDASDKGFSYAIYAYKDTNNNLNNACNVIMTDKVKTLYSICAISSNQPINFLQGAVKNIVVKAINE